MPPKTGATRHQKFLKSEKAKTKLKSKKDLPKGTNVTKTNFKVKKIVIKEQLKKHGENEALSTRKLNLKDLLSRLNHFNTQSRTGALDGIKELLITHPYILEQNLGQLIHSVTPLVLNVEKIVRHESFKVLQIILSNVTLDKIDPFFDILSTYLRSAMTHIDMRIREDSLLFLDLLLLCTPKKVAYDIHKIIPNFLDMISKLRVDSKPGRTLVVNLGSQITSAKWRVKVLHRLQDYLQKFIKYNNISEIYRPTAKTTQFFNDAKPNYYPLFNQIYTSTCHISCFSSQKSQDASPQDEVEKFKVYIDTLMPLLFETWLEMCPKVDTENNIETVISEDAASLLKYTIEIISLIWTLIEHLNRKNPSSNIIKIFSQKYRQPFSQHFVNSFPYATNSRLKQKNANSPFENVITDPKLVKENLEIGYLFAVLNPVKSQKKEIHSVLAYIEKTLNQNIQEPVACILIKVLHVIFSGSVNGQAKNLSIMDALFSKVIGTYFNKDMLSSFKQQIFSLLCKISLNQKLLHFHQTKAYETWLSNLPDILLEDSINTETIDILYRFAIQNNELFNSLMRPKLLKIIKNLPRIKVHSDNHEKCSYNKLFSLFYWVKYWDSESLNLLEQQLLDNVYDSDNGKFIFDTFKLRTGGII